MPTPQEIRDACRLSDRLFVLNPEFKWSNIYSQQLRALALVQGMAEAGDFSVGGNEVAIVGGGVGGLTLAAALATRDIPVVVIEKKDLLNAYRQAVHRELHPNVITWPFQEMRSITNLPFLNWSCDSAPAVRDQILEQWKKYFGAVPIEKETVKQIEDGERVVSIECESGTKIRKPRVIVATGFLPEMEIKPIPAHGYWTPHTFQNNTKVLVSGARDGALIDLAYQFFGPQTVSAARMLAYRLDRRMAAKNIRRMESIAQWCSTATPDISFTLLEELYDALGFDNGDTALLNEHIDDRDMQVELLHRGPKPYSPFAAPVNKALLAFCKYRFRNHIKTVAGSLRNDESAQYCLTTGDLVDVEVNQTLVRHGANPAAPKLLAPLDRAKLGDLQLVHSAILEQIQDDNFDYDFYCKDAPRPKSPNASHQSSEFFTIISAFILRLLQHMRIGQRHFSVHRSPEGNFKISSNEGFDGDDPHLAVFRATFPITVHSQTIVLTESATINSEREYGIIPTAVYAG